VTHPLRKLALVAHITSSVGWLGAVAGFLVLSIAGLTSRDPEIVRGAYLSMKLTAGFAIVPLAFASLLTGIVQSLGTPWGLFRHYWVLAKLSLTVFATIVVLLKMRLIAYVAGVAAATAMSSVDLSRLRTELVVHAAGGLLVLLVITTVSVFKPWGLTLYGQRKLEDRRADQRQTDHVIPSPLVFNTFLRFVGMRRMRSTIVSGNIAKQQLYSRSNGTAILGVGVFQLQVK
jgi:hypothetical protein